MKNIFILFSIVSISFLSCTKEVEGPQGMPGEDGSNPKLYFFDIPVSSYEKAKYYEDNSQFYNDAWLAYGSFDGFALSEKDLVLVYMHQTTDGGPDNYFQALPYTDYFDNSEDFNHYSYGIMDDNGDLIFSIRRNDGSDPFNDMSANFNIQYNVYVIKSATNRKAELPKTLNIENEQEVKAYLNISQGEKIYSISE